MKPSELIEAIRTPHKAEKFLIGPSYQPGDFDSHAIDCPFPFRHEGAFWMTYVGWDGRGYRSGLARSENLLDWEKQGMILDRGPAGSFTAHNAALTSILRDNDLMGAGELKRVDGRFVGTYHAYPDPGYEEGPGAIGLCYSTDLRHWEVGEPVLRPDPGWEWEAGGLYKSWLMEWEGLYYLFYNAKNRSNWTGGRSTWPWHEQTGLATSPDLIHWQRCPANPLLRIGAAGAFDDLFTSEPCVLRVGDAWVMFYFGNCSDGHARDSAAFSSDLLHWEKTGEVLLEVGPPGSLDERHAHKPGMIAWQGRLYHFYCAVSPAPQGRIGAIAHDEYRGISAAWRE